MLTEIERVLSIHYVQKFRNFGKIPERFKTPLTQRAFGTVSPTDLEMREMQNEQHIQIQVTEIKLPQFMIEI